MVLKNKVKILAVGDVHGDKLLVQRLAEKVEKEKIDLVVLAGDITYAEQSTEGMIGPFLKAAKKVLIIPGNHESIATVDFMASCYENSKNLHGSSISIGDLGIFGAGTANVGIHGIGDEGIWQALEEGHRQIKDKARKIMITHIHPASSKSEIFRVQGSEAVTKAIYDFKPEILINSHIHEAGGMEEKIGETQVFNVSRVARVFEL